MKKHILLSSAAMLLLTTSLAQAAQPVNMDEMQKQIDLLTSQVEKLNSLVDAQGKLIAAQKTELKEQTAKVSQQSKQIDQVKAERLATVAPSAGKDAPSPVKISMEKGLKIESADGKYSFQPFGRAHLDVTVFNDDVHNHPSNAHIRRARLGAKGNLGDDFNYKVEFDFGGESANIKETYLSYTGIKAAEIFLGNMKPAFGLEQNTSSSYMEFMEFAPVTTAFTRDEIIGVAVKSGGEDWSFAAGVFNEDPGNNNTASTAKDEAVSLDAHASTDLLRGTSDVLHIGLGGSIREPNETTNGVTISAKPAGTGPNMVSAALTNVERAYAYGPEFATILGPFSAQAEYIRYTADRSTASDVEFDGWYAQASYFLTGESRTYKGKTGNFDRIKPKKPFNLSEGGMGAWEVLARYDQLDLNDAGAGVNGGAMHDWTLGVNWYMRDNVRMMFNYVDVNTDNSAVVANDDPQIFNARAQFDF